MPGKASTHRNCLLQIEACPGRWGDVSDPEGVTVSIFCQVRLLFNSLKSQKPDSFDRKAENCLHFESEAAKIYFSARGRRKLDTARRHPITRGSRTLAHLRSRAEGRAFGPSGPNNYRGQRDRSAPNESIPDSPEQNPSRTSDHQQICLRKVRKRRGRHPEGDQNESNFEPKIRTEALSPAPKWIHMGPFLESFVPNLSLSLNLGPKGPKNRSFWDQDSDRG